MQDIWVNSDSKFTEVAAAFVHIQNFIDFFCVVGSSLYNFAVFKCKADIFIGKALEYRWSIVGDVTVGRVADWCCRCV